MPLEMPTETFQLAIVGTMTVSNPLIGKGQQRRINKNVLLFPFVGSPLPTYSFVLP
jgi:hypothetical protein